MNIGEAARASGISAKMIRYYEQIGLIRPAVRSESNYRVYSERDVESLRFLRRARDFGFSPEQIHALLTLWRDPARASHDVKAVAVDQIAALEARIAEMQAMARTLADLARSCHGDARPDCPILDDLASAEAIASGRARRPFAAR